MNIYEYVCMYVKSILYIMNPGLNTKIQEYIEILRKRGKNGKFHNVVVRL